MAAVEIGRKCRHVNFSGGTLAGGGKGREAMTEHNQPDFCDFCGDPVGPGQSTCGGQLCAKAAMCGAVETSEDTEPCTMQLLPV